MESYHVSPDGLLRFIVRVPDGDITMGFDGYPWHTHGSILAELASDNAENASEQYVRDLVSSRSIIAVKKISGQIQDVWITDSVSDDVAGLLRWGSPDEVIEFRLWDGTKIQP